MIKTFIKIFMGLILVSELMAQENKRVWSEGKLNWSDFSERKDTNSITEFEFFLGYSTEKQRFGDTIILRNAAKCYMDKNLSWVKEDYKIEQYLRYNQVIFDITEIYRRRLQYELDRVKTISEIGGKFYQLYSLCNIEIEKFQKESNAGQDINSLVLWEKKARDEINTYPDTKIPEFENRKFGYALHAGFGTGFFTESLGEHFSPSLNLIFGFDLAYKKSILYLNATLASDKIKRDYISENNWYKNQHVNVAIMDVSYGYALIDNAKFKLSPFGGLGITEFTGENKDNTEDELRIVDYNLILGINADYKFRTRLKILPNPGIGEKEKVETSIRARLYITKANFFIDLQGYSINLTIGLCGFGNFIRIK